MATTNSLDHQGIDLRAKLTADRDNTSEIARKSGVSQPTVSRYRSDMAPQKRRSKAFIKLCNYYKMAPFAAQKQGEESNQAILDAIGAVWDQTETHAQALAKVILSLKGLGVTQTENVEAHRGHDADRGKN